MLRILHSCCVHFLSLAQNTTTPRHVVCLQNDGTFYLIDDVPKFAKYMSEPIKSQQSSSPLDTPGYFVAGIVKGYLVSSGFPAEYDPDPVEFCPYTVCAVSWDDRYHRRTAHGQ